MSKSSEQIKDMVREKYGEVALQDKTANDTSCCSSACCESSVYNIMTEDYSKLEGYNPDADLGLGCGLPTQFARIKKGDTVIDLGSGAGNDCFIARAEAGEDGRVIGIDFTPAMIARARENAAARGFRNVEFLQGDIEHLPVPDKTADVIVSNCVLNLVPNKSAVFAEIYRALKPGGHFSISDIVLMGALPAGLLNASEMYAGCVAGAIQKEDYLELIRGNAFSGLSIQKERRITLPDDILSSYLSADEMINFRNSSAGIYSITVYAEKNTGACCGPECCQ
ncbi:MAG TPA: arsenite methyltransferase [Chryseolinea sp.]|nr:arsenite methyltransferase [Chryseolinea sp.]